MERGSFQILTWLPVWIVQRQPQCLTLPLIVVLLIFDSAPLLTLTMANPLGQQDKLLQIVPESGGTLLGSAILLSVRVLISQNTPDSALTSMHKPQDIFSRCLPTTAASTAHVSRPMAGQAHQCV
ncbi:hypothetical protein F5Y18DRAFT_392354 [Xylariaceae sp. FL1019]|nr:hypothetical protein F5Y18DRAFT_392354 [Xylariaceae sp. FL1019]